MNWDVQAQARSSIYLKNYYFLSYFFLRAPLVLFRGEGGGAGGMIEM